MYEAKFDELINSNYYVKAGDRIAQLILSKQEEAELVEVDELSESDRCAGGFGSTGVR